MVIVGIRDGVVELCVAVEDLVMLQAMYPEHVLIEQSGDENVGWTYDGVSFTPPQG